MYARSINNTLTTGPPSPYKYGKKFSESSDVDVVIVSEPLFHRGTHDLFEELSKFGPQLHEVRKHLDEGAKMPIVDFRELKTTKEAIRNFVFENFNPGLLSFEHRWRREVFEKISSTAGLFLSLEPQVFVSKIRCRVFRTWKAAEDYDANTLREAKNAFSRGTVDDGEEEEAPVSVPPKGNRGCHQPA